jgi:hypothetical protein
MTFQAIESTSKCVKCPAWIAMVTKWQRDFGNSGTLEMWRLWRRDSLWIWGK